MDYLKELVEREKQQLKEYLIAATDAYNLVSQDKIIEINVTSYKNYDKVLEVVRTYKRAYINIDMNSNLATAQVLSQYLYEKDAKFMGFIGELYE